MGLLLGVDGGGTKTLAVLADQTGKVVGVGRGDTGNFQTSGIETARTEVQKSIELALQAAGSSEEQVIAAYFGMAGADRPRDFQIVHGLLAPIVPQRAVWSFDNDALLGLWAATSDGVGVGVVCGTGTNIVGVNQRGQKVQVGGMGSIFGDYAGGSYIGELAIARAMRGLEGRGCPTALYERICDYYGVRELLDLVDFIYESQDLALSALVPLVVEVAAKGDEVARGILLEVGQEMGVSANAAIRRLFTVDEQVTVVGVGSVFQKSESPLMYDEFVRTLRATEFQIKPMILASEPVVGALFGAAAQRSLNVTSEFNRRLQSSLEKWLIC